MSTTTSTIQTASLHYREGSSDKVYHAAIEPKDDGYIVSFAYGRRGSTLNTGLKTSRPVTLDEAERVFAKLVKAKLAKGYQHTIVPPAAAPSAACHQPGDAGRDTGVRCQLLNPVDESDLGRLLINRTHCLQEKLDGRRLLVRKQGGEVTGINRRDFVVAIPEPIRLAVEHIPHDCLIDGEAVGDTLHAFDLLEAAGHCLRQRRYIDRFASLMMLLPSGRAALRWVSTAIDPDDKLESYEEYRSCHCEGVVFKEVAAPHSPGRPNSGGPQLKLKFVETASFVVTGHNAKRSVTLGLYDDRRLVPAGSVTIPPNHPVPSPGQVCEVRYLYAYRQSGSVYQPVYLGGRTDVPATDCVVGQLKFKDQPRQASA